MSRRLAPPAAGLAAALLLAACGGAPPGAGGGLSSCPASATLVSGKAVYDDKPYDLGGFRAHVDRPVRFALVEVRDADAPGTLLATAFTDARGNFCAGVALGPTVRRAFARVKADAQVAGSRATVLDYSGDIYYVDTGTIGVRSGALHTIPRLRIREDTPWKVGSIGGSVSFAGGAFNILDVVTGGLQFIQDRWGRAVPNIKAVWQHRQTEGLGTFFVPGNNTIHIKGQVLEDSDEYDDDIILHEFGHFALHNLSKDTSVGGVHYLNGNTQDARLAWSEGWANFFSAMVRDTDPGHFSNRAGIRATLVDALFTQGVSRSLRFAYEMATPEAIIPDETTPDNQPIAVDADLFRDRVKYITSEVSVSAALWDIYAGQSGPGGWDGIGRDGMLGVIEEIGAEAPPRTTFVSFWDAFAALYPATAAVVLDHLIDERLLTLTRDEQGADDTPAEVAALTGPDGNAHVFPNLFPGVAPQASIGHTLYPEGDVDLFRVVVDTPGTYRFTTENLNDGADTYLRILAADGATPLAENDNYDPLIVGLTWGTDDGLVHGSLAVLSYPTAPNGSCGPYTVRSDDGRYTETGYACPPNAANRPGGANAAVGDLQTREYLASRVDVPLDPGTYYVEVTRASGAPPSAGPEGGYDLRVEPL